MKLSVIVFGAGLASAAAAAQSPIPQVSAVCRAQSQQLAQECPLGKDFSAFMSCKAQHSSIVSPKCAAELRAHITAVAAACRRDQAPSEYSAVCPTFKAHPKAF